MKHSPSWEAARCIAAQEFPNILYSPKVHNRVHESPPLVPILSQMNPIHTSPSYVSKLNLSSPSYIRPGLPLCLFPFVYPTKTLYAFTFSPMLAAYMRKHVARM